ncbi:MAG: hypothetical protein OSA99_14975 [Acidimicrobiales bacterium]|nr:hypothetical protein [Acidimicrobiales bacterium]
MTQLVAGDAEEPLACTATGWVKSPRALQGCRKRLGAQVSGGFWGSNPCSEEAKDVVVVAVKELTESLRVRHGVREQHVVGSLIRHRSIDQSA